MGRIGQQTWVFPTRPAVRATGTVVGPKEGKGPLGNLFDFFYQDAYAGTSNWESAERAFLYDAIDRCLHKAGHQPSDVDVFLSGDLTDQITTSTFTARHLPVSFLGQFGACSVSMQTVALAALLVDTGFARTALASAASHNSTAERQFRYPTEYGGQKPPTAQCTASGAGVALVTAADGKSPSIDSATIGRVIDMGIKSPWEMGAAMAPAAVDTILAHFEDRQRSWEDYDLIATGDLGRVGYTIAKDLLAERGVRVDGRFVDCGVMLYDEQQPEVFSGGSGAACSAIVTYASLLRKLSSGTIKRLLVVATGALLSTVTSAQGETIPCIAHGVVFERGGKSE